MTPAQAIKAGALAIHRGKVREIFNTRCCVTLSVQVAGKTISVMLDDHATRAALNGADLDLTERLKKLGVHEE